MAVTITAKPEPAQARVAIKAEGGAIGDAFFIGRRGRDGILSLVRETSEASRIWERDPAGQRSNLFTRPRFELTATAARIFTNLFQNPKFVTNPAVNNVVRTNLAANPGFEELVRFTNEWGGGAGTAVLNHYLPFTGSQFIRSTWTKAGLWGGIFANTFDVVPGREYAVSVYVRTSVLKQMRLVVDWVGAGESFGPSASVRTYSQANTGWTRLTWTDKVPAGVTAGIPCVYLTEGLGQTWKAGEWMDVDAMLIEAGTVIGDYFDGSYSAIEDNKLGRLTAAWTGEANRSSSVLYPEAVYGVAGDRAEIRPFQDGALILPNTAGNASAALLDHGNQMQAGGTYTIGAVLDVIQRDGLSVNERAGSLTVTSLNGTAVISEQRTIAANLGSGHLIYQTFEIPAGTTKVEVRVWNGSPQGYGRTAFRQVRIVEGSVDPGFFLGDSPAADELTFGWTGGTTYDWGRIGTSFMQAVPPAGGFIGTGVAPIASRKWRKNGAYSLRLFPTGNNIDSYLTAPPSVVSLVAGKTYTFIGTQRQIAKLTGSLHIDSRRVRVTGTGMSKLVSAQPANTAGRQTTLRWEFTVPAGATNVRMEFVHGGSYGSGDLFWDEVLVTEGVYTGSYFDGEFGNTTVGGWNGAKDASTSYRYSESLSITVYDYETRQGQTVEYFVLTSQGVPVGEGARIQIPEWGTWLKDPFRPHLNTKLWFNSDDTYTRQANRVLLQPRGSRLPIAQWERRTAPEGKIRLLTETADDARRFTTLIDEAGVVFLDVAEDFGVPFRYASVGDVAGTRAVSGALRDPHRYWDLELQEVAAPIGEPSAMAATYENLMARFASYLELRASVPDYKAVTAGEWL